MGTVSVDTTGLVVFHGEKDSKPSIAQSSGTGGSSGHKTAIPFLTVFLCGFTGKSTFPIFTSGYVNLSIAVSR